MLLLILLAFNSLFSSCTSVDKPTADNIESRATHNEITAVAEAGQGIEEKEIAVTLDIEEKVETRVKTAPQTVKVKVAKPALIEASIDTETAKEPMARAPKVDSNPTIEKAPAPIASIKEEALFTEKLEEPIKETISLPTVSHADFNSLLQKHVKDGLVNYSGFKADGEQLDAYLDYLSNNAPSTSDRSKSALAYWMNAYNAFTIKLIVDNLPVSSIRDLHGGNPWDKKWITIGGKSYSLNNIEHDIIRPVFNEPRIHFAVVCAAKSCPPLDNQAFTAENVDANLERLTRQFINNPKFNTLTENKVTITKIMDWYGKDFGNVVTYLQKYADTSISGSAKVKFMDYDWSLNGP